MQTKPPRVWWFHFLKFGIDGRPPRIFVSELGLYFLVLRSKKSEARAFQLGTT